MYSTLSRRNFLGALAALSAGHFLPTSAHSGESVDWFRISLAQWSFKNAFYSGEMKNEALPEFTKVQLGLEGIDYLSDFWLDSYRDLRVMSAMKQRAADWGIENLMIMLHKVGDVAHGDPKERQRILDDHRYWIEAAHAMGCSMIRVNARSAGTRQQQLELISESIRSLCEFSSPMGVDIIIENLWGTPYSHNAQFIMEVVNKVDHPRCGTLPDFNNFRYDDPYQSVALIVPSARSLSAKSLDFTPTGLEKYIDYHRMLKIAYDGGYRGFIGIEWEGCKKPPLEGVLLTRALLMTAGATVGGTG
ncbi:MAG: TIM barrel protein [Halieaceae bacterium]|nr:TIM barrel protein [Halieaceae bacterium]